MLYLYFWVETPKPIKDCLLDNKDHRVSQHWVVLVSGLTHGVLSEETSCGPWTATPLLWEHKNLEVSIVLNSVAPMAALLLHSQYNLTSKKILSSEAIEKLRIKMSPCETCFRSKRPFDRCLSYFSYRCNKVSEKSHLKRSLFQLSTGEAQASGVWATGHTVVR